jgi:uncharacterized damage-inducible protein DinB
MSRPTPGTYPAYFENYISKVQADTVKEAIVTYGKILIDRFKALPVEKADYAYAADKWTLKEVLQHVIDTERIFAYRAVAIARKETISLPGFDENSYAANSKANSRDWNSLLEEFSAVRNSTDLLLKTFDEEQLSQQGTTNNNPTTVKAIAFIVYGHILHHLNIINERYL